MGIPMAHSGQNQPNLDERGRPHRSVLLHGEMFGEVRSTIAVPGFALSRHVPDPHVEVQQHTHDTAHYVFVTHGPYLTSAEGTPEVSENPILVYNPPGTTHRDRFQSTGGRFDGVFFSLSIAPEIMAELDTVLPLPLHPTRITDPDALALVRLLDDELRRHGETSGVAESLCLELTECTAVRRATLRGAPPRWLVRARTLIRERVCRSAHRPGGRAPVRDSSGPPRPRLPRLVPLQSGRLPSPKPPGASRFDAPPRRPESRRNRPCKRLRRPESHEPCIPSCVRHHPGDVPPRPLPMILHVSSVQDIPPPGGDHRAREESCIWPLVSFWLY